MKKYEVLKDCSPFLIEGTVLESSLKIQFTDVGIKQLIFKKYIKEPKPEFTEDDMKKAIGYSVAMVLNDTKCYLNSQPIEFFEAWKKSKS